MPVFTGKPPVGSPPGRKLNEQQQLPRTTQNQPVISPSKLFTQNIFTTVKPNHTEQAADRAPTAHPTPPAPLKNPLSPELSPRNQRFPSVPPPSVRVQAAVQLCESKGMKPDSRQQKTPFKCVDYSRLRTDLNSAEAVQKIGQIPAHLFNVEGSLG